MTFKNYLLWIWQLPQNICGIFYKYISKNNRIACIENEYSRLVNAEVYLQRTGGAVTLGKYIFVCQNFTDKEETIKHECGHVLQSKILGPLYITVIGIRSLIHACLHDKVCSNDNYYHFFTERWANKLIEKFLNKNLHK